ncbi:MAG: hypothetical protein KGQ36_05175 [Rickettsiales bacterium]|nr:hypothetical protein [Rickettsiales bacterium]
MKKIAIVTLSIALFSSFSSMAQEGAEGKENMAKHKAEIIASLNKEKSIIDSSIACINAASTKDAMKVCHDQKKSSMDALRSEREAAREKSMSDRKAKLQDKINKIDEKQKERSSKSRASDPSLTKSEQ